MSLKASTLLESPDIYPLKFDGANLVFVRMSRDSYQQSIFTLPNRIIRDGPDAWTIPFSEVMNMVEQSGKTTPVPNIIFQIAHCGSTLLSRALDHPGSSLVIREPFVLRQFSASPPPKNEVESNARQRALRTIMYLLGRQYENDETVLIKANVPINYSIDDILENATSLKGVLLFSDFESYLVAVLKSEERCMWAKHVVRELGNHIQLISEFSNIDINSLDSAQSAAVLWLSQMHIYNSVISNDQMKSLDAEHFFTSSPDILRASAEHLEINLNNKSLETITNSDLFTHHAKNPEIAYSEDQRQSDQSELNARFEDNIKQTKEWCEANNHKTKLSFPKEKTL